MTKKLALFCYILSSCALHGSHTNAPSKNTIPLKGDASEQMKALAIQIESDTVGELNLKIDQLEQQIKQQINSANINTNLYEEARNRLEKQKAELEAQLETLQKEVEKKEQQIIAQKDIEQQLPKLQQDLAETKQELDKTAHNLVQTALSVKTLDDEIERLKKQEQQQSSRFQEELKLTQDDLDAKKSELTNAQEARKKAEDAIAQLTPELTAAKESLALWKKGCVLASVVAAGSLITHIVRTYWGIYKEEPTNDTQDIAPLAEPVTIAETADLQISPVLPEEEPFIIPSQEQTPSYETDDSADEEELLSDTDTPTDTAEPEEVSEFIAAA